jgi:hypothetical protein
MANLLSGPSSFFTASKKRSWSSSVHLNLDLLVVAELEDDWDELSWTLAGDPRFCILWVGQDDTGSDDSCGGVPYMS